MQAMGLAAASSTLQAMERLGLVGLPNAGKSSLFNAVTGGSAPVAAHPFSTTESTVGVAQVPDPRLTALAEMSKSKKVVPATLELVDIAGLVAGASTGEGLGNRFLAGIREVDAVVLVLRAFEDDNVVGGTDPLDDLHTLELELVLADVDSIESQLPKRQKMARADKSLAGEVAAMEAALEVLSGGTPLYRSGLSADVRAGLRSTFLLTDKPMLAVVNLGEDQLDDADRLVKPVAEELGDAAEVLGVSVQLEAESARLDAADRAEMLDALGLGEGALPRVIRAAYHLLGPAHVPHHRRQGVAGVDVPGRGQGPRVRRCHPLRPAAGVHPGRGHPVGRAARARVVEQGQGGRAAPGRGQGLRGRRRGHAGDPFQCVSSPGNDDGYHRLVAARRGGVGGAGGGVDVLRAVAGPFGPAWAGGGVVAAPGPVGALDGDAVRH